MHEWYLKNKEYKNQYSKYYRLANLKQCKSYGKLYRKKHKKEFQEYNKLYQRTHKVDLHNAKVKYSRKIRKEWETFFKRHRLNKCSLCGYDKDFSAIDFHHIKDKKFGISYFITRHRPTKKHIKSLSKEVNKCVILCANCHRIMHYTLGGD